MRESTTRDSRWGRDINSWGWCVRTFGMFTARPCVVEEASASATRGGRRARGDVVVVVSRVVVRRFSSSRASVGARDDAGERVGRKRERGKDG